MITTSLIPPGHQCSFLVNNYLILKSNDPLEKISDRFIPEGTTGIVFNFQGGISVTDLQKKYQLPSLFFVKPILRSLTIEVNPPSDSMIALCRTPAFSRMLGIDLSKLPASPHHAFGNTFEATFKGVLDATSTHDRIAAFESVIKKCTIDRPYQYDVIDQIYDQIIEGQCPGRISEIAEIHHLNSRSFRRNFRQRVGITAKELIRIVRVQQVWKEVTQNPRLDNLDIAYLGGFYDQSHFIRDFKMITGETPGEFFGRNLDHVRFISGKDAVKNST